MIHAAILALLLSGSADAGSTAWSFRVGVPGESNVLINWIPRPSLMIASNGSGVECPRDE